MNQYIWFGVTQVVAISITLGSATALERRRLRASGNFEKRQQHYADLFEVLYKVTNGLIQWHKYIFVSKDAHDLEEIIRSLEGKDVQRLDALNYIWASDRVAAATTKWIESRRHLESVITSFQEGSNKLEISERAKQVQSAAKAKQDVESALNLVRNAIKSDLYLSRSRSGKSFWLLPRQ